MARITIIGGHGKIALRLASVLTDAGNEVDSLIRNPDHSDDVKATGAIPVVADVENLSTDEIAERIRNSDAVVFSAGAGGGNPERTYAVDRDAAIRSMDAAVAAGVPRYVMVSYLGATTDHGVPEDSNFFPYAESKAAADDYLRQTELSWTVLAPSRLTLEEASGKIEVGPEIEKGEVSREDVALVGAVVLRNPKTIGKTIGFNNGPTPIEQAVDAAD